MKPQGMIAILTDSDGRVQATKADFDHQSYGGLKLREAQLNRARDGLGMEFIRRVASHAVFRNIDHFEANQIIDRLVVREGWKVTTEGVGYDE
ncbi:hypothetical protein [Microvirga puerhi]|uniref:Uncharacterized protein n=1 Tax=Microvirga puerhi TaxID=2876078 RepID=A0ABS7VTL0_9HYPH|nr:hypothetical protein [Microvirga puerhi]MBZ6078899.1 hypothetical protein [Microvirga puerhi]